MNSGKYLIDTLESPIFCFSAIENIVTLNNCLSVARITCAIRTIFERMIINFFPIQLFACASNLVFVHAAHLIPMAYCDHTRENNSVALGAHIFIRFACQRCLHLVRAPVYLITRLHVVVVVVCFLFILFRLIINMNIWASKTRICLCMQRASSAVCRKCNNQTRSQQGENRTKNNYHRVKQGEKLCCKREWEWIIRIW